MNSNMSPIDWATRPLKKYADFSGRAPRAEYWWFVLAVIVFEIIAMIIDSLIGTGGVVGTYGWVWLLFVLAVFIPSISVAVRRLHDIDRSGWWILIAFVPIIGLIMLIYWYTQGSDPGDNRYGPNPYG
jgi:uncharacterized membrane protein YhaH (DUF805 family)